MHYKKMSSGSTLDRHPARPSAQGRRPVTADVCRSCSTVEYRPTLNIEIDPYTRAVVAVTIT